MFTIIGVIIFTFIFIFAFLLVCGCPLGEFTMGGQEKILPKKLRIGVVGFMLVHLFSICMLLQAGGYMPMWFGAKATKWILVVIGSFLAFNTIMNGCSRSKKEKYLMTPLSLCVSFCCFATAF